MNSKLLLVGGMAVAAITLAGCQSSTNTTMNTGESPVDSPMMVASPMTTASTPAMPVGVEVGGSMMSAAKNIVENASTATNLSTLVAAVKEADLVTTLSGPGPFTVFAPTNDAFKKVPAATLSGLMKADKKIQLTHLLTYHVVPGKYDTSKLTDGQKLNTVYGEQLTVSLKNGKVMITDSTGKTATIETPDVYQGNGVVHVIDTVLMPAKL